MRLHPRLALAAAVTVAFLAPWTARAGTATNNLNVSATVSSACVVGNATLSFGSYDPVATNVSTALDATTTITVTCTGGTSWSLGLGTGGNPSAGQRRMKSGTAYLVYELYRDGGRTQVWGDATLAERVSGAQVTTGDSTVTVYGRIPAGQLPPTGTYTDTVTATIFF